MGLAEFIRDNAPAIIVEWEAFAQSLVPTADHMSPLALRNHISEILDFVVHDISAPQTSEEQVLKSKGGEKPNATPSAAEIHASLRFDGGFNMDQMVSEFRALRASIVKLWFASVPDVATLDIRDLTRFDESIDQALTEAIHDYTQKVDAARNLFLGILSHDLRNPLGAISMSAELTMRMGGLNPRQVMLQTQIVESAKRASEIVVNLLDLTRARLGTGLPILRGDMDMGFVANSLVDEMRAKYPRRTFHIQTHGALTGFWDQARIGQVFSNLLGNAVEHGFSTTPISVAVDGGAKEVVVSVHNQGQPISADTQAMIFSSLARTTPRPEETADGPAIRLGLGLFICREIVEAHGGALSVVSSEVDGTTFTVTFPRAVKGKVIELVARRPGGGHGAKPDATRLSAS